MDKIFNEGFIGEVNGVKFIGNINEIEYVEYVNRLFDKKLSKGNIMLLKKWYSLGIYLSAIIEAYNKMLSARSHFDFLYMAKIVERQYEMDSNFLKNGFKDEPSRIDNILKIQKTIIAEEAMIGNSIQLHEFMTCLRDTVCVRIMSNNGNEILSGEVSGIKNLRGFHHSNVNTVMAGHFGLTLYIDDFSDEKGARIDKKEGEA